MSSSKLTTYQKNKAHRVIHAHAPQPPALLVLPTWQGGPNHAQR